MTTLCKCLLIYCIFSSVGPITSVYAESLERGLSDDNVKSCFAKYQYFVEPIFKFGI